MTIINSGNNYRLGPINNSIENQNLQLKRGDEFVDVLTTKDVLIEGHDVDHNSLKNIGTKTHDEIESDIERLSEQVSGIANSHLGTILYNDPAPRPGKNGLYTFSSAGAVTWLNNQVVKIGDEVSVKILDTDPVSYVYTYINNEYEITSSLTDNSAGVAASAAAAYALNNGKAAKKTIDLTGKSWIDKTLYNNWEPGFYIVFSSNISTTTNAPTGLPTGNGVYYGIEIGGAEADPYGVITILTTNKPMYKWDIGANTIDKYLSASSLSDSLTLDSSTNIATSKSVKQLNDEKANLGYILGSRPIDFVPLKSASELLAGAVAYKNGFSVTSNTGNGSNVTYLVTKNVKNICVRIDTGDVKLADTEFSVYFRDANNDNIAGITQSKTSTVGKAIVYCSCDSVYVDKILIQSTVSSSKTYKFTLDGVWSDTNFASIFAEGLNPTFVGSFPDYIKITSNSITIPAIRATVNGKFYEKSTATTLTSTDQLCAVIGTISGGALSFRLGTKWWWNEQLDVNEFMLCYRGGTNADWNSVYPEVQSRIDYNKFIDTNIKQVDLLPRVFNENIRITTSSVYLNGIRFYDKNGITDKEDTTITVNPGTGYEYILFNFDDDTLTLKAGYWWTEPYSKSTLVLMHKQDFAWSSIYPSVNEAIKKLDIIYGSYSYKTYGYFIGSGGTFPHTTGIACNKDCVAERDGIVDSAYIYTSGVGNFNMIIGTIDQRGWCIPRYEFSVAVTSGQQNITINKEIKKGELIFVRLSSPVTFATRESNDIMLYSNQDSNVPLTPIGSNLSAYINFMPKFKYETLNLTDTNTRIDSAIESISVVESNFNSYAVAPVITDAGTGIKYKIKASNGSITLKSTEVNKVIVLGNSITCHEVATGLWWGAWGMAASSQANDYVHKLKSKIALKYPSSDVIAYNIVSWESGHSTYNLSTLPNLSCKYINSSVGAPNYYTTHTLSSVLSQNGISTVLIRVGENVTTELNTLTEDFENLLTYIYQTVPGVDIIVGGNFWYSPEKDALIKAACDSRGIQFVSMGHLDKPEYKSSLESSVGGEDGQQHLVSSSSAAPGVAAHPGDAGMAAIANLFYNALGI